MSTEAIDLKIRATALLDEIETVIEQFEKAIEYVEGIDEALERLVSAREKCKDAITRLGNLE